MIQKCGKVKFGVQISMVHARNYRVFEMLFIVNNKSLLGHNKKLQTSQKKSIC